MTDKQKYSDIFWFSLFHELGHIINNDFFSNYSDEEEYRKKEEEADAFAKEWLIDSQSYATFVLKKQFDRQAIVDFAKQIGIHPSIVLGRLQKEHIVDYRQFHDLKLKYSIVPIVDGQ